MIAGGITPNEKGGWWKGKKEKSRKPKIHRIECVRPRIISFFLSRFLCDDGQICEDRTFVPLSLSGISPFSPSSMCTACDHHRIFLVKSGLCLSLSSKKKRKRKKDRKRGERRGPASKDGSKKKEEKERRWEENSSISCLLDLICVSVFRTKDAKCVTSCGEEKEEE